MTTVESEHLEFKREYTETIRNSVIAFANGTGGTILVGVDDDGTVRGLDNIDETSLRISSAIRHAIKPDVTMFVRIEPIEREGKRILEVKVERGSARPYYLAKKGLRPAGVYVRQGPASVQATDARIRELIRENSGDEFESARSLEQELTFGVAEKAFADANVSFGPSQRKSLGLVLEDDTYSNLALLLSDQCPFTCKLAVWGDDAKMEFQDRLETTGSILKQLDDAVAFIERWNAVRAEYKGIRRIDIRNYPPEAIREALLNSFVHRDYALPDSNLTSLFADRLEILSIGGLVPWFDDKDFALGISALRNRKLATLFYRLGLIEAFGTGLLKIKNAYKGSALEPKIEHSPRVFKITLFNRNVEAKDSVSTSMQPAASTSREKAILELIRENGWISRADVEKRCNVSPGTAIRDLRKLLADGKIAKDGSGPRTTYGKP